MGSHVEIEARHAGGFGRGPAPVRCGDHRQARRGHPGLLRAGDDEVDAPVVHLERDGTQSGHAVDEDQALGRRVANGAGQVANRVHDPGRGLVVGEQDRAIAGVCPECVADDVGSCRPAPLDLDLRHVRAVDPGDLREPIAKAADRDRQDPVARRERVDDGGLEPARARTGQHHDVTGRPEERLHPVEDPPEHRRELGTAVVDHLAGAGLSHGRREGGRTGDPEIGFEAVHRESPRGASGRRGWSVTAPRWSQKRRDRASDQAARPEPRPTCWI